MKRRILVIDGHPDSAADRFIHALARAYEQGARAAGHEVRSLVISRLKFPLLQTAEEFQHGMPPPVIREAQSSVMWADHIVILFPLWLGAMPALLKGFLEQLLRPNFAFAEHARNRLPKKLLGGKSARVVVTMGMPSFFYRLVYRAHSLKSLERNILSFCGIGPIRDDVIGMVDDMNAAERGKWLKRMVGLGRRAC